MVRFLPMHLCHDNILCTERNLSGGRIARFHLYYLSFLKSSYQITSFAGLYVFCDYYKTKQIYN